MNQASWGEEMTAGQAADLLQVNHRKLAQLIRAGTLAARRNPLDMREKLVRTTDVLAMKAELDRIRTYPKRNAA